MCYHYIDDKTIIINSMIAYGFLFVKISNENKRNKTRGSENIEIINNAARDFDLILELSEIEIDLSTAPSKEQIIKQIIDEQDERRETRCQTLN